MNPALDPSLEGRNNSEKKFSIVELLISITFDLGLMSSTISNFALVTSGALRRPRCSPSRTGGTTGGTEGTARHP